jgi:cell division protein FtsL
MTEYVIIALIFVIGFVLTVYIFRELKVNALNDKIHELEMELFNRDTEIMKMKNEIAVLKKEY